MKKSTKALSLILSTAMVFSMTACGSSETTTESKAETTTETVAETTAETTSETVAETTAEVTEKTIEPCTVTFWHGMGNAQEEELTKLTDEFNASNEYGITVELVYQGAYGDLSSKLDASALSGELPDMSQVYNNWITDYVDKVVTLDDFIATDFDNWEDIVVGFREEAADYGDIKVLPFNKSTYLYFYNKTLYDELGLTAPTTWDELVANAKVIKAEKDIPTIGWDDMTAMLEAAVVQHGGTYSQDGKIVMNDETGIEAMSWLLDLFANGYATLVGDDGYFSTKLSNGNIAGYVGSSTGVTYITVDGWELGVAPIISDVTAAGYQAGTNIAMFSQDANKQLACWEYMKYLTSTEVTAEWAIATGYLPVRTSAFESEAYQAYLADSITAQAAYEQIENTFYEEAFKGSNEVRNTVGSKMTEYIQEGTSAEDAMDDLMTEIEYILGY